MKPYCVILGNEKSFVLLSDFFALFFSSLFLARSRKSATAKKKEEKEDEEELSDEVSSQEERGEKERGGRGDNDGQNISQNQVSFKTQIKL